MEMKIGPIAFLVGMFGSILLGLLTGLGIFTASAWMTAVLVVAGLIIGAMNITANEAVPIMVAALVIGLGSGGIASLPFVGKLFDSMLVNLAAVALPTGLVVGIATFYNKGN